MRNQVDEDGKHSNRVQVSRELQERQLIAGEDCQETVDARDFVKGERHDRQLCACLEADEAEETLRAMLASTGQGLVQLFPLT